MLFIQGRLGEQSKFYYDEKLKMWREEGVDEIPDLSPPPPPPTSFPAQSPAAAPEVPAPSSSMGLEGHPSALSGGGDAGVSGLPAPLPTGVSLFAAPDCSQGYSSLSCVSKEPIEPSCPPYSPFPLFLFPASWTLQPPPNAFSKKKSGMRSRYVDTFAGNTPGVESSSSPKPPLAPARNSFLPSQVSSRPSPRRTLCSFSFVAGLFIELLTAKLVSSAKSRREGWEEWRS